jgi:hypothetical protein
LENTPPPTINIVGGGKNIIKTTRLPTKKRGKEGKDKEKR